MPPRHRLLVDRLWNGEQAKSEERTEVSFSVSPAGLLVEIATRFHGDPSPAQPAGRLDGLWEYEVVELFLANEAGHYLELEFGPHGHYLALLFSGVRQQSISDITLAYQAAISGQFWRGSAHVPSACLPPHVTRANAYAIHGQGGARRYLAAHAVPGATPDFHQPQCFRPW